MEGLYISLALFTVIMFFWKAGQWSGRRRMAVRVRNLERDVRRLEDRLEQQSRSRVDWLGISIIIGLILGGIVLLI